MDLFFLIACEFFTRFHHFVQYGLFFPIYKQTIHYSPSSLQLATIPTPKLATSKDYDIIISGGSVACSYGITQAAYTLDSLIEQETKLKVLNVCKEGNNLQDEMDTLKKLAPKNKTIVFITGFNDAFLIKNIQSRQKTRVAILNKIYPLSTSLFILKLVYKLTSFESKSFSKIDYLQQIERLKAISKNNKSLIFHQPYLSNEKQKSLYEQVIFKQQVKSLEAIHFVKTRTFLTNQLSNLGAIDLQNDFDLDNTQLFSDICHLSTSGNLKLSKLIQVNLTKN